MAADRFQNLGQRHHVRVGEETLQRICVRGGIGPRDLDMKALIGPEGQVLI